jgi:choline dehydrogenase
MSFFEHPDYIVIGSGSAGSTIAYRLGENPAHQVLVLEFGGTDMGPLIQMPAALSYPMNMPRYDWGYKAEPEPKLNGRSIVCPRGKVIGGSSSINGMIYVRGNPGDYHDWAQSGADGWDYKDVLPYFKRMETSHGFQSAFRGTSGPLQVTRGKRDNPLHAAFVQAAEQAGYVATEDYNGYRQEGFGAADMTVWRGSRFSTAKAYLKPALKKKNVQLVTRALVDKIIFEDRKAVGVQFTHQGQTKIIKVKKDIILSAGSINSPAILQRSGIGNADHLQLLGIKVLHHLPGVGENLQDHLEVYFQVKCLQPITLYKYLNPISKMLIGMQWMFFKSGPGATNQFETLGFIRSDKNIPYPDIQFHFLPVAIRYDGTAPSEGHGFQLHVGPMRSGSRGYVKINSADPTVAPTIRFNYMTHEDDFPTFRKALRLSREILGQDALKPYAGPEIQPGNDVTSDEGLDEFIKNNTESAYHPCGTCKIGRVEDPTTVVQNDCKVKGFSNLYLADSSIFPRITNGNLNAPSIMTGEKASDHILGKQLLSAEEVNPFYHPQWQESQR